MREWRGKDGSVLKRKTGITLKSYVSIVDVVTISIFVVGVNGMAIIVTAITTTLEVTIAVCTYCILLLPASMLASVLSPVIGAPMCMRLYLLVQDY